MQWREAAKRMTEAASAAVAGSTRALRDGLLWLLPFLLLAAMLSFFSALFDFLDLWPQQARLLHRLGDVLGELLPYAMSGSIGAMLAIRHHLPRPPVAFVCVALLGLVSAGIGNDHDEASALALALGLFTPLVGVPLMAFFHRRRWTRLAHADVAGANVVETVNLVLPALFAALVVLALAVLLKRADPVSGLQTLLPAVADGGALGGGLAYAALNSLSWFLGVHGYYLLQPLLSALNEAGASAGVVVNEAFLGAYVFIGGSGATWSLLIALLLGGDRHHRTIALVALPTALFNVNELLLFGLPIILNPRLFLPFLAVPLMNLLVAAAATGAGLVPAVTAHLPLNAPVLVNAWLVSGGEPAAVLVQLLNVALGCALYLPAVRALRRRRTAEEGYFAPLDTTFNRRQEEVCLLLDDPISEAVRVQNEQSRVGRELERLSVGEFMLHYQPIVDPASGRTLCCEALLRVGMPGGGLESPAAFLPWFERAGLLREVDLWVARAASRQLDAWAEQGLHMQVEVNLTVDTLADEDAVTELAELVARHHGALALEVTEQALSADPDNVAAALRTLRRAGARIYIDDFGTGHSSLSYLHLFEVDAIKIDRSFVLALDGPAGQRVFSGLLALARQLGLDVVVEGVETAAQLEFVGRHGTVAVQGWYYSRPLAPVALEDFLRTRA